MKKINITIAVSAVALVFALAGCDKPFEYTPSPVEDSSKTFVGADVNAARNIEAAGEDILIPFVRSNKSGALEVNLFLEDTTGIFSLVTPTITFADGDSLVNASVSYDYTDLVMDVNYTFSVGISDKEVISEFLPSVFPVSCIKAWENLGTVQWYDEWWTGGPFEKTLLKSPDGSENYRLINPWSEEEIVNGGLTFVTELPYLEFSIDEDGYISYGTELNMGFQFNGRTCHMLHPSILVAFGVFDEAAAAAEAANSKMVLPNVAQFYWYPVMNYTGSNFSWWGSSSAAYISFPGGPDLTELLGLDEEE